MENIFYEFDYPEYLHVLKHRLQGKLVRSNDCLEWQGAKTKKGYGQITVKLKGKKSHLALCHRLLWELVNGKRLSRSEYVRHKCKNKSCLNSEHLITS